MNRTLLLHATLCVAAFPASTHAQTRELTGKVLETATGLPIPNAEVGILGQGAGVCTNARGEYRLRVPMGEVPVISRARGFNLNFTKVGTADAIADLGMDREGVQAQLLANEPSFYIDGIRLSGAPEVNAPKPLDSFVRAGPRANEPLYYIDGILLIESPDLNVAEPLFMVNGVPVSNAPRDCSQALPSTPRGTGLD